MSEECIGCGSLNNLQKHHILPVFWQGNDRKKIEDNRIITLCSECHLYMSPDVRRIDKKFDYYGRYTQAKANKICRNLNEKTNYIFKVNVFIEHFKTVPPHTYINISLIGDKDG